MGEVDLLEEDIDFTASHDKLTISETNENNVPTSLILVKKGICVSGDVFSESVSFDECRGQRSQKIEKTHEILSRSIFLSLDRFIGAMHSFQKFIAICPLRPFAGRLFELFSLLHIILQVASRP